MKKYIGFILMAGLILSFSVARAEENEKPRSSRPALERELKIKRDEFRNNIQAERKAFLDGLKLKRDEFRNEIKAKKEEFKKANTETKKRFWNNVNAMLGERFEVAIKKLEKAQEKVGDVIEKLKTEGKDTANATEFLDLSKQKLADAKAKIAEIKALLPATGETITPEIFEKIKLLAREAKDLLKESKKALHDSVKAIKDLKDKEEEDDED